MFNTISYPLSQVSVHLLCPLCLSHANRSLFGTDHYNDFEINLMNEKNQIGRKLTKIQGGGGGSVYFLAFIFFHVISCKCKNKVRRKNGSQMPS